MTSPAGSRMALQPLNTDRPAQILSLRKDLLGGRLNSGVNALRIARRYGVGCRIRWPDAAHRESAWDEALEDPQTLFAQSFVDDVLWTAAPSADILQPDYITKRQDPDLDEAAFHQHLSAGHALSISERTLRHKFPWERPDIVKRDFRDTFMALPFSQDAKHVMAASDAAQNAGGDIVCLHVRRGDIVENVKTSLGVWPNAYFPDEVYFAAIAQLQNAGATVHLYCGDPVIARDYQTRFPQLVVEPEDAKTTVPEKMLFDFSQLYSLSQASLIVSNGNSAFSAVAANLGNAPHKSVRHLLGPEMMKACCAGLLLRLAKGPEAFHYLGEFYQSVSFLLQWAFGAQEKQSFQATLAVALAHDVPLTRYLAGFTRKPEYADFLGDVQIDTAS